MQRRTRFSPAIIVGVILVLAAVSVLAGLFYTTCDCFSYSAKPLTNVVTIAGLGSELGEPFGIAVKDGETFVSDGLTNKIWRMRGEAVPIEFATGLSTPSAIAFDKAGGLIVADTGSNTIKKVDQNGVVSILAGTEGVIGDADGPALSAKFNAPIGVAVLEDGAVAVADTYNDKIKIIRDGEVTTLAGTTRGFADGSATSAKFDTPSGVTAWADGSIIVADTMNSRIRVISADGSVATIAGNGDAESRDGTLFEAAFYRPSAVAISPEGSLFIGDGNAVRTIKSRAIPVVETITKRQRGFADGPLGASRFNRVSGIAIAVNSDVLVADSDNAAVRRISSTTTTAKKGEPKYVVWTKRTDAAEFRTRQPARWPYDPPDAKRDIAGTLGEIRGEIVDQGSEVWFHNGLDIAGGYGEKARFLRDEKVLNPASAENFDTLRELIRLPTVGYIHIRLGRDASGKPFGDSRYQFEPGITGVRVRRGTEFKAGDVIGTLNAMNHVHMIAGPSGDEMNALSALELPGVADTTPPVIEEITFFDRNWQPIETQSDGKRINFASSMRIVVRAFDRMDGNPERRRLGVFRLGYQVLKRDLSPVTETNWNISFDRNPSPDAVKFAYAQGSKSGATGETIFRYIVTNKVNGDSFSEGFFDPAAFSAGEYVLRVSAADYFGNSTSRDFNFEVEK